MALHRQMYGTGIRDTLEDVLRNVLGNILEVYGRNLERHMISDSFRRVAKNLDRHPDRCM